MHIDWNVSSAEAIEGTCPACGDTGSKAVRLKIRSAAPPFPMLPLGICGRCGTALFATMDEPGYEGMQGATTETGNETALAFYLEQGAGIDVMAAQLSAVNPSTVRRYLEIGGGFGFSLDFARSVYGWTVKGIDPGFAARRGRELLDLDITSAYLRTPSDAGDEPFDLVLCSEVIEHIFEPLEFLSILRGVLAPGGTLLLTTPNAGVIAPETSIGAMLPLLSPGYHVSVYSRAGFETLLRRAGFTAVAVVEDGATLRAAVSMTEGTADLSGTLDRARYIEYLAERAKTIPADTPFGLGLRYRRVKELTHAGRFAEMRDLAGPLVETCRTRWGLQLDKPETLMGRRDWPSNMIDFHKIAPFNVCGILYCLGMMVWHDDEREKARVFFQAAAEVGEWMRATLQDAGIDDGETAELSWRARAYDLHILAWLKPTAAAEGMERLAKMVTPVLNERIPPAILTEVRRQTFTALVNLGHYAAADRLVRAVESDLDDCAPMQIASASFALGILSLNHRRAPKQSASWFGKAAELCRQLVVQAPGQSEALLWEAVYHQGQALVHAKMHQEAGEVLGGLLNPAPGLPAVPPVLRERTEALVRSKRLSV